MLGVCARAVSAPVASAAAKINATDCEELPTVTTVSLSTCRRTNARAIRHARRNIALEEPAMGRNAAHCRACLSMILYETRCRPHQVRGRLFGGPCWGFLGRQSPQYQQSTASRRQSAREKKRLLAG